MNQAASEDQGSVSDGADSVASVKIGHQDSVLAPRSITLVVALALIVLTVVCAILLGATPIALVIATSAMCFLVGTTLVIQNSLRWNAASALIQDERRSLAKVRAAHAVLLAESRRAGTVLSHLADGVVLLSPSTEIMLLNDAARQLLALPASGLYSGKQFNEQVRIPEINEGLRRAWEEGTDQNVSVELVGGGGVRPIAVRIDHVRSADSSSLLLVVKDETEAHRVESVRREFIANVSHELKTPLAAIKGYAETIELAIEDDPEAAKHFVSQMDEQCLRLEALIADMMRLARAQSGKGTLVVQSIDLYQVIDQAMVSFLPVAKAKEIALRVVVNEQTVRVLADENAALTITQNLISNAIRHTEAKGHVTVSCRKEGRGWILAVQDDGVGIAEEFQDRIFERFYRVDRSRKSYDEGTGIGLSIVKNLTRALDGTVKVVSRPGEGATFEVWLPSPM